MPTCDERKKLSTLTATHSGSRGIIAGPCRTVIIFEVVCERADYRRSRTATGARDRRWAGEAREPGAARYPRSAVAPDAAPRFPARPNRPNAAGARWRRGARAARPPGDRGQRQGGRPALSPAREHPPRPSSQEHQHAQPQPRGGRSELRSPENGPAAVFLFGRFAETRMRIFTTRPPRPRSTLYTRTSHYGDAAPPGAPAARHARPPRPDRGPLLSTLVHTQHSPHSTATAAHAGMQPYIMIHDPRRCLPVRACITVHGPRRCLPVPTSVPTTPDMGLMPQTCATYAVEYSVGSDTL